MPIFEYQCDICGQRFEQIQKFSDAPMETCTACGAGSVRRLLSSPAIQFKGAGWYVTDYARKGSGDPASTESSESTKSDTSTTTTESKPATSESTTAKSADSPKADTKKADTTKS
jgi:putative FmdB family regulatory protein